MSIHGKIVWEKQKEAKTFASVFMREKWLMGISILFPFSCQPARARVCDILPIFNTNTYWPKWQIYVFLYTRKYCIVWEKIFIIQPARASVCDILPILCRLTIFFLSFWKTTFNTNTDQNYKDIYTWHVLPVSEKNILLLEKKYLKYSQHVWHLTNIMTSNHI